MSVVACVGAGRMGRGLAHSFAYAGYEVRLLDAKPRDAAAQKAFFDATRAEIRGTLATVADLGGFDASAIDGIMARVFLYTHDKAEEALARVHLVWEAVPETIEAKTSALSLIDDLADDDAIIASTTSTYLSTQLADLSNRPARFLNAHWLNPAFLMPLVEVSPAARTDRTVVEEVMALLTGIGKVPVECRASPGYIVPRIQTLAMNEAARMVEEGVATAEDIDKAVKYGFGFRFATVGLLEFIDWGGGDTLYYASRYLAKELGTDRFEAPKVIDSNMVQGKNGLREGQGFYDYTKMDVAAYRRGRLDEFMQALKRAGLALPPGDIVKPTA